MDLLTNPEQDALVAATRDFIDSRFAPAAGHGAHPARLEDGQWKDIAELGWFGLANSEEAGGDGATVLDEALLFREIGRALVPGPILTTLAAARLADWLSHHDLARELVGGQTRVARAVFASPKAPQGTCLLIDPLDAGLILLVTDQSAALHAAEAPVELTEGIEDGSQIGRLASASLGEPLLATEDPAVIARLRRVLSILTSAQLAGIAAATTESATSHGKDRVQFGRPIAAFQAIKHQCANMAINSFAAEHVMFAAALEDTDYTMLAAAAFCRRAAFHNARANIQIHGAMGFTVEDTAHRYVKRVHTLCQTEGFNNAATALAARTKEDA